MSEEQKVRFLLNVIDGRSESATGDEMAAIDTFNDALRRDGHWVLAVGITHPSEAVVIDNRNGAGLESLGPIHQDDQFVAGLWIIEASSREEAVRLAGEGSRACNRIVEVRQLH